MLAVVTVGSCAGSMAGHCRRRYKTNLIQIDILVVLITVEEKSL